MKRKNSKLLKNYFILIIIFILSCGFTLYLCEWYNVYSDYKEQTPVIRGTISEIVYDDLNHYVVDVPNIIVYVCTPNSDECRNFEKTFKKYVIKNGLNNEIVYLNVSNVDQQQFLADFNNTYKYKIKLKGNYPAFISFKDGKIDSILQGSDDKKITIAKVNTFFELNIYND